MDRNKIELLNLCTDLRRAIMVLTDSSSSASTNNIFVQNIIKNLPHLKQLDPNIEKYLNSSKLRPDSLPNKLFAENLLMMSLRLQHYLGL